MGETVISWQYGLFWLGIFAMLAALVYGMAKSAINDPDNRHENWEEK